MLLILICIKRPLCLIKHYGTQMIILLNRLLPLPTRLLQHRSIPLRLINSLLLITGLIRIIPFLRVSSIVGFGRRLFGRVVSEVLDGGDALLLHRRVLLLDQVKCY